MKRLFALLLLFSHMNTSMFLPQVAEVDTYSENGDQLDDINSLLEYFLVTIGWDNVADDEDDDSGQQFRLVQLNYVLESPVYLLKKTNLYPTKMPGNYYDFDQRFLPAPFFEVMVPPPESAGLIS